MSAVAPGAVAPRPPAQQPGRRLADRAWPRAAQGTAVLVVALGACEQHGPHLPLDVDLRIARALAEALCRRRPGLVAAPALPYGASGEHADFPGTLSLGTEALAHLLVELGRSASGTAPGLLLVNGHGGNLEAVRAAVGTLRGEGRDVRALGPRLGGDAHAGRTETSLMLHLAPGLVELDRAVGGATAPATELEPRLRREGVRAVSPTGVLGDPAGATAAEGRRLLRSAVERALDDVDRWWPALTDGAAT